MSAAPQNPPPTIDVDRARRRFGRAVATSPGVKAYNHAAALQREVSRRMLERLDYVKLDPQLVLDAGCGTGHSLPGLAARFATADVLAIDFALPMLDCARAMGSGSVLPDWLRRWLTKGRISPVAADFARLPLRDSAVGCIWSNLALHWARDPAVVLGEWHRVLQTGGLVQFSLLGPDTLRELRGAWTPMPGVHVHPFLDMHDIGDMLVNAGFAEPVMDMELITLTYREPDALFAELKALGATNASSLRPRGLLGRKRWAAIRAGCEALRTGGMIPATIEVIYGHAWKPPPRPGRDGAAVVRIEDIGGRRR